MIGYLPSVVSETEVEKEEDKLVRFGGAGEVVDGDIVGTIHRGAVDEFDRGVVAPRTGAQDTENEFCVVEGLGGNVDPFKFMFMFTIFVYVCLFPPFVLTSVLVHYYSSRWSIPDSSRSNHCSILDFQSRGFT